MIGIVRVRAKQINQILASIEESKKTAYDEIYIEELYQKFQNHEVDDSQLIARLRDDLKDKKVLILAPGSSLVKQKEEIERFIQKEMPVVISANFASANYHQDYIFVSNAMRYGALDEQKQDSIILITSNLMDVCEEKNVLNYAELCFDEKGNCDNCVIMLMKLLLKLGIGQVSIAGFDGYQEEGGNYVTSYMASQHTKGLEENIRNRRYVEDIRKQLKIEFLTDSLYDK